MDIINKISFFATLYWLFFAGDRHIKKIDLLFHDIRMHEKYHV